MADVILQGDCIASLRASVADESVQTCITSPPYFGLRDYGHDGQIGLESTPDEFVAKLVAVFREVHRVLRDDGTLWLNLGDSYANDTKWGGSTSGKHVKAQHGDSGIGRRRQNTGLKSKDLMMIPARVALALQADGWYVRQDIIWQKPNPMPESVTDRCTKAHEYLFLLSKSERYYFDHEAIKEPVADATIARLAQDVENQRGSDRVPGKTNGRMKAVGGRLAGNVNPPKGQLAYEAGDERQRTKAGLLASAEKARQAGGYFTRNKRSVWTVATRGYKGAHFATYPPALIEPCVLAGSKPGDLVLDPFGGSGTTAQVALQHGRRALLCELNPKYVALAEQRLMAYLLS